MLIMEEEKIGVVVALASEILFGSNKKLRLSDSEEDKCYSHILTSGMNIVFLTGNLRQRKSNLLHQYETWMQNFTEQEFFNHFRMGIKTFESLLVIVGPLYKQIVLKHHGGLQPVTSEKALLIVLWFLAKGDTYISTADRFCVSITTTHLVVKRMLNVFISVRDQFIKWPSKSEADLVVKKFQNTCGFPGVIGAIDGCHIMCKVPELQQDSYQNRKCQHSVVLQGICTSEKLLSNIFVGFPGRSNDARVFQNSPLYIEINEFGPENIFYDNYHLIGDKAYTLEEWLLVPFKNNGRLSERQKKYNTYLSKTRVCIEHVFGLLKGRWRILLYVNAYSIEKIVKIVFVCCILHNICLLHCDYFKDLYVEEIGIEEEEGEVNVTGIEKRHLVCEYLSQL